MACFKKLFVFQLSAICALLIMLWSIGRADAAGQRGWLSNFGYTTRPALSTLVTPTVQLADENAVLFWDNVALDAIRLAKPGPPIVAPTLAIVHTAMYEAWSQYDTTAVGTLLGGRLRRPLAERTAVNQRIAMTYAAYRVLDDLFPDLHTFPFYTMTGALPIARIYPTGPGNPEHQRPTD